LCSFNDAGYAELSIRPRTGLVIAGGACALSTYRLRLISFLPALAVQPAKSPEVPDAAADSDRLDSGDLSDDLE
jgi:hypothetical protein